MASELTAFRNEHHALHAHLDAMRRVADEIDEVDPAATRAGVENVYDFLSHHLVPHAKAEDEVIYPLIDKLTGSTMATVTMRRDHEEVLRLVQHVGELRRKLGDGVIDQDTRRDLRRTLYGLHALVTLHFAKEDDYYLPVLERSLDQTAADDLSRRMDLATQLAE